MECYSNLDYAKRSTAADVWAFATTLWEIFTFGDEIKNTDHVEAMRVIFNAFFESFLNLQFFSIMQAVNVCRHLQHVTKISTN